MKNRLLNIFIAVDQLLYAIITFGHGSPIETMSAAAYRLELRGRLGGKIFRPLIDAVARPLEKNHCEVSFNILKNLKHLPTAYKIDK